MQWTQWIPNIPPARQPSAPKQVLAHDIGHDPPARLVVLLEPAREAQVDVA
jgi:hypothetical protein